MPSWSLCMQLKSEILDYPIMPRAYSIYFEVHLLKYDFGKRRGKHNAICNQQLLSHLEVLSNEGIELSEKISNAVLIETIKMNPQDHPHESLTWHHCHSQNMINNVTGLTHLVSSEQHKSKCFSALFHPCKKGGYYEWAVPSGAPWDKPKGYPDKVSKNEIPTLPAHGLAPALLVAVGTNNHEKLNLVLARAKNLKLSADALTTLVTQAYQVGLSKRQETLLHIATMHGNMALLDPLLNYFTKLPHFSKLVDSKGNAAAHIAAKRNRDAALQKLKEQGIDLTIKNKKLQTAYSIAQALNHQKCIDHSQPGTHAATSEEDKIPDKKRELLAKPKRDPQFVYGASSNNVSQASTSTENQEPRKTYRERIGLKPMTDARREEIRISNEEFRKQRIELEQQQTNGKFPARLPLPKSEEPHKTYRERIGLKPMTDARREEIRISNAEFRKQRIELEQQHTNGKFPACLPLPKSEEPRKTYSERIGLM